MARREQAKKLRMACGRGIMRYIIPLLPDHVYALCMGTHERLGANSLVRQLPLSVLRIIVRLAHTPLDINANSGGGTALSEACKMNHMDVVELLLSRGAKVDHHALFNACWQQNIAMTRLLLQHGADPNALGFVGLMGYLCGHDDFVGGQRDMGEGVIRASPLEMLRLLYDYGADLKNTMATRDGGLGVLHVAAELRDSVGIIIFCLDKVWRVLVITAG